MEPPKDSYGDTGDAGPKAPIVEILFEKALRILELNAAGAGDDNPEVQELYRQIREALRQT